MKYKMTDEIKEIDEKSSISKSICKLAETYETFTECLIVNCLIDLQVQINDLKQLLKKE